MKLAEALNDRADLQRSLEQLKARLLRNSKVQEGEKPLEDPKELLFELDGKIKKYEKIIQDINYTNSITVVDGASISDLIATRDAKIKKANILNSFLSSASDLIDRYSNSEIKTYSTVDVVPLQKQYDALAKEVRDLNVKLQELNWTTELVER